MANRSREGTTIRARFERLLSSLLAACQAHYGERLVSLAVFGSVGRGTPRPDSDIDLLLIVDPLPSGRRRRMEEFEAVEEALHSEWSTARAFGFHPSLSPVFKTPAEAGRGSLLFLDMIEDARLLFDRDGFLLQLLRQFKTRLDRLGARRIWSGSAWHWDLKPDYKTGEVFEI